MQRTASYPRRYGILAINSIIVCLSVCLMGGAPIGAGGDTTPPTFKAKAYRGHNLGIIRSARRICLPTFKIVAPPLLKQVGFVRHVAAYCRELAYTRVVQ